jgi:hypothetical protein
MLPAMARSGNAVCRSGLALFRAGCNRCQAVPSVDRHLCCRTGPGSGSNVVASSTAPRSRTWTMFCGSPGSSPMTSPCDHVSPSDECHAAVVPSGRGWNSVSPSTVGTMEAKPRAHRARSAGARTPRARCHGRRRRGPAALSLCRQRWAPWLSLPLRCDTDGRRRQEYDGEDGDGARLGSPHRKPPSPPMLHPGRSGSPLPIVPERRTRYQPSPVVLPPPQPSHSQVARPGPLSAASTASCGVSPSPRPRALGEAYGRHEAAVALVDCGRRAHYLVIVTETSTGLTPAWLRL